jgi:chromosome segregation ATPase
MSKFNPHYLNLLNQLPQSIKNDIWKRLTTRLHNPLTVEQASSINSDVEVLLNREVDNYAKKKFHQRSKVIANNTSTEDSIALSQFDELKKRLSIRESKLNQKEQEIENVISTRVNYEYNRLKAESETTILKIKQKLEDNYKTAMEKASINNDKIQKQVLHKNSKIEDLSTLLKDTKMSLKTLEKKHNSTISAFKKLEVKNRELQKIIDTKNRELQEIIDAKDQKIIDLNNRILSFNPRGCGDGTIEPEIYSSTTYRDLWWQWRNNAKHDLEIRKKFAFRKR